MFRFTCRWSFSHLLKQYHYWCSTCEAKIDAVHGQKVLKNRPLLFQSWKFGARNKKTYITKYLKIPFLLHEFWKATLVTIIILSTHPICPAFPQTSDCRPRENESTHVHLVKIAVSKQHLYFQCQKQTSDVVTHEEGVWFHSGRVVQSVWLQLWRPIHVLSPYQQSTLAS